MYGYISTPFGWLNLYDVFICVGIVVSIIVLGILIVKILRQYQYLLFLTAYLLMLYIGQYASAFVRCSNDGALDGKMNLAISVSKLVGSHFLGHVITFSFLCLPILWFVRALIIEVSDFEMCSNQELIKIGDILFMGLPIQHIFNRVACLCQGCCYGVAYDGIFAITLPNNKDLDHKVFPCQILEIACMIALLVIVCYLFMKGKHIVGEIVMGFSITFFVAEFFTANPYAIKHFGLTYVQIFSIGEGIVGILYCKLLNRICNDKMLSEK